MSSVTTTESPLTLIAGMNYRRVLGDGRTLLWKNTEDMQHFKEQTQGHVVIMGRNTFDSLPFKHGLPGRTNIVVSRQLEPVATPTLKVVGGLVEALTVANELIAKDDLPRKVFCIGGAEIYRSVIDYASDIILTIVPNALVGNVTFPVFENDTAWTLEKQEVGSMNADGSANVYTYWHRTP